jgi:ABC-type dipeptide/oligopeptide/nickel transport system permease component
VHGDFGASIRSREPVRDLIAARIPATVQLAAGAMLVALASAVAPQFLARP